MIRPAVDSDLGLIVDSWLKGYSSSELALAVAPKDDKHTAPCPSCHPRAACGHRVVRSRRSGGVRLYDPGPVYWREQRKIIGRLIETCNVAVCSIDGDEMIDGWIVRDWTRPIVDYVSVRLSARGKGVARQLVADLHEAQGVEYTHLSAGVDVEKLPKGWRFNPWGVFR